MSLQLDIICENTVGRPIKAVGEHGFACLLQTPDLTWLFDTGSSVNLIKNLYSLGHRPGDIDGIILSHGHYDHCGGLLPFLKEVGTRPVYAHPEIFKQRYWQGQHELRDIGLAHSRAELEDAGADFCFLDELTELADGIYFSGTIPKRSPWETGDPHLVQLSKNGDSSAMDSFDDDGALAIESVNGLIILLGCAHSGLINTVDFFREQLGQPRIHAIVGGTHLGPASDEQFSATVAYLEKLGFDRLGVSHCTGQIRSAQLHAKFPNKVFFANVGASLKADLLRN